LDFREKSQGGENSKRTGERTKSAKEQIVFRNEGGEREVRNRYRYS